MKMLLALSFVLTSTFASGAMAQESDSNKVTSLLYVCGMSFKVMGKSASLVLGYTYLKGEGKISCYDILTGRTQDIPTKVTIRGPAVGINYQNTVISAKLSGIGLSKGPESLLGNYLSIRNSAAVGIGVGVTKSIRVAKDAVVLDLGVEGTTGLGFQTDLLKLTIEAQEEAAQVVEASPSVSPSQPTIQQPATVPQSYAGAASPYPTTVKTVSMAPVEVVYVQENQQVQIVDSQGQLMKVIILKQAQ